ncbi:unnamed protein product, partial [Mesorhabditis belari]|uniref:CUB domain-containing protein n=1 Tax=Mesorhabditis belari TaxID=2138241 RepID=A0AAF3EIZ3_9BILA
MLFLLLLFLLYLEINGQCFDKKEKKTMNETDDEPMILKNPGYPEKHQESIDCNWIIKPPPNHQLTLTIDDFQPRNSRYSGYMYLFEILSVNGSEVQIPIGRTDRDDEDAEAATFLGQAFRIRLLIYPSPYGLTPESGLKFHITIRKVEENMAKESNCGLDRVIIVNQNVQHFSPRLSNISDLEAEGNSLQFSSDFGKEYKHAIELPDVAMLMGTYQACNDKMSDLDQKFLLHNSQSFGNEVLLKICRSEQKFVEFSVQTGPNRCICSMEKIVLSHDTNITLPDFPPGVCDLATCESEVSIAATKENSTHYERILLEAKRFQSYQTPFTLRMKGIATNNSRIASSLVRTRHDYRQVWMLPTSFNISYYRNVHALNFTLMHVSRKCTCFPDSIEPFLDLNKNTLYAWLLTMAIDENIKSSFIPKAENPSRSFSTGDYLTSENTADFIYLHFGTRPDNVETEINISINLEWKGACQCEQTEYRLDDLPIWVSSPYYPSNYCNNMNCSYSITAADGAKIRLAVIALSMYYNDQLTYEEHGITKEFDRIGEVRTTESNQLFLRFVSDGSDTSKGFQLKLETYWLNELDGEHFGDRVEVRGYATSLTCSPRISGKRGSLALPNKWQQIIDNNGDYLE